MKKLIVLMQMSVDGFVGAGQPGMPWELWAYEDDWPWDPALKREFNATLEATDTILLSSKMVEGYIDHWTNAASRNADDPDWAFARRVVDAEKVVLTSKPMTSRWERTTIAVGPLADSVNALKQKPGKDIITFGGVAFVSALIDAGLVDELRLYLNPAVLGSGETIFNRPRQLRLNGTQGYDCGIVVNRYAPGGKL